MTRKVDRKITHGISQVTLDITQVESSVTERLQHLQLTPEITDEKPRVTDYRSGKQRLHIDRKRGDVFHLCSSLDPEYICCNVHVLGAISNCPYDCSYCFLQNYLTNSVITVIADTAAILAEVRAKTQHQPWRFFRVGTWELGDSLAMEPITGAAAELVRAFATWNNVIFELKTKSDCVDGLLDLPHGDRCVVSWTMNPQTIASREELRAASISARLDAMVKVISKNYLVAIHFDPMILHPGWEVAYDDLVKQIFAVIPCHRIAWISVGSLRFNPEMKRKIEDNFPGSRITSEEIVLGKDGKMRYIKPLRIDLYTQIVQSIRHYGSDDIFVYLCMERADVWQRVFTDVPHSIGHFDYLMTASLQTRFPGLVHQAPKLSLYAPYDEA